MLARLTSATALTALAALTLAGCAPPEPTEEEVETEARIAWEAYLDQLSEFGAEPQSANREALLAVASPEVADEQLVSFAAGAEAGIHAEGHRETSAFNVVLVSPTGVRANVCVDATDERIIAENGNDVSDDDRLFSFTIEVQERADGGAYFVAAHDVFDGSEDANPCN